MSSINVNTIKSRLGGPPTLPSGVVVSAAATFNNDVSIGGTLTYEDVTNVDVVGLITARSGIKFGVAGVGGTITAVGNAILSGITTIGTGLSFADSVKASFGNSNDLQIYHDASNAFIANNGSGDFYIQGGNVRIRNVAGSANLAQFVQAGKVGLYFNGSEKFETHNTGVKVTGDLDVTGITTVGILTAYGDVNFTGITTVGILTAYGDVNFIGSAGVTTTFFDKSDNSLKFKDGARAKFGTDLDLHVYHNGSNSVIREEGTGNLNIQTTGGNVDILVNTTETAAKFISDGAVELYYNDNKKFETTNSGTILTGITTVTVGTDLDGYKVEEGSTAATSLNGEFDYELENGHVQRYSAATGGNYFPDFRVSSSQSLSSVMDVGDVVTCTLIVASSSHYCTTGVKIDNSTSNIDLDWVGGSAPSAANGSGFDIYSFTIMKTAATPAYHIIGNASGAA